MKWFLGISFGELMLKGKNRKVFINKSRKQILKSLKDFQLGEIILDHEKLFIEVTNNDDISKMLEKVKMVFGLSYVYPCIRVDRDMKSIEKAIIEIIENANITKEVTFKAFCNRADKTFPLNSMDVAREIGGVVLRNFNNFSVNLTKYDIEVNVDIRKYAYVYLGKTPTIGGLPIGTGGRALLLLSGGIDSPVAAFEMASRGVEVGCLHFHSYPFTSERAKDKAKRLAEQLSVYIGDINYYEINLLEIYTSINKNCSPKFTTILSRRFMMRIAEKLAEKYRFDGFITGEALGQVASQTIQSISVINDATSLPIFRPLINMDKSDIIEKAQWIETYDISIEPYDDCCSFFAPDKPVTKPKLSDVLLEEEKLDVDSLVEKAIKTLEGGKITTE